LFIGPGIAAMTTALPQLWPNAPLWVWLTMFAGGLSITITSLSFLLYDYIIRPYFNREVKMVPLTTIICGVFLIIFGVIYHISDKNPIAVKQPSSKIIVS